MKHKRTVRAFELRLHRLLDHDAQKAFKQICGELRDELRALTRSIRAEEARIRTRLREASIDLHALEREIAPRLRRGCPNVKHHFRERDLHDLHDVRKERES